MFSLSAQTRGTEMRNCRVCFRKIRVNIRGNLFKHCRGMETCPGSGQKVTR